MDKLASTFISRRDFLRLVGIGGATLTLNSCRVGGIFDFQSAANASDLQIEPDIEITLKAIRDEVDLFEGAPTRVWRYQGEVIKGPEDTLKALPNSYLGPIITVNKGQNIRIHFINQLPEPSIIHWHGLHVPVEADGHPRLAVDSGQTYTYNFTVTDRAGTYWYHPHPHGRTGVQVYGGLAGLFIIHDEEELELDLPSGEFDLPIVIQDRRIDRENQLSYMGNGMMDQMIGFLGDRILINGTADSNISVKARPYRFRLLNGSNSRIYKLAWDDDTPFTVIGTDGGLLEAPIQKEFITLAPAQRVDLWVDFSDEDVGGSKNLINLAFDALGGESSYSIFSVNIGQKVDHDVLLPKRLSSIAWNDPENAVNKLSSRSFELAMGRGMGWTLNGRSFELEATAKDEQVRLGDLEIWEFINQLGGGMGMMGGMNLPHPMHVHGLQFQIIERSISSSGRNEWETLKNGFIDEGWHDTVLVMPGESVKVLLKFEDYTGLYLYHCHNLEHEDMGMMRNYRVV